MSESAPATDRDRSAPAVLSATVLWQVPSLTFAVFLVAIVAVATRMRPGDWVLAAAGLALIAAATVASLLPTSRRRAGRVGWLPVVDLVGAVLINLVGSRPLGPTILLCALPALWLSVEFGRRGIATAIGLTTLAALAPYAVGTDHRPLTTVDLLTSATPACTVVVLGLVTGVIGRQVRQGNDRLRERTAELSRALRLAQDRMTTMYGVLASVNAAVVVLPIDAPPITNERADRLAARAGVDPAHLVTTAPLVFAADGVTPVPPQDQPLARALRGEEFTDVLHWLGESGDQTAMVVTARQLVAEDGQSLGRVVTAWDATELTQSVRVREEFLTTVSHELRTPLTSVIGYLELLEDHGDGPAAADPTAAHILKVITRNATLLLDRITQLLSASEGPATSHDPVVTDVSALVRLAMEKHGVGAGHHCVQLDLAVDVGVVARVDPARFEQVLDNLVSNAIKFSSPGGHVVVELEGRDAQVRLTVSDDGVGMSQDEQRQAFQRFYRAESATRNAIQGLGIGLGLVEAIVAEHGGSIEVVSAPGSGTTMRVLLPCAPAATAYDAGPAPATARETAPAPDHADSSAAPARRG